MEREQLNALVTKAKNGDSNAMNDLINASYQDMYFYALKIVKKDHLAADATQDSCIEMIQTISKLRESAAFVTWCRRIVYHQCTKRIGKSRTVPIEENEDGETILDRIPDDTPNSLPEEVMENRELRQTMLDMIDRLPEGQRSALMLYYYERLSVKQIAEIQGENENTVKSRLHQGRKAVKKQVEAYETKTGTKLYSISIVPLLYFLFHSGRAEADAASAALAPSIQAAVAPSVAAASGAGAAVASSLGVKIAAGALAVALTAGAVGVGSYLSNRPSDEKQPSANPTKASTSQEQEEHIHTFEQWAFDEDTHWQICECGAFSQGSAHTYDEGVCTVCYTFQPLPSGDLLTFDCTTLTGHWISISKDYEELPVEEFYISGDGSVDIQGVTYYPISNTAGARDQYGNMQFVIYFRDTPYDSTVDLTYEELFMTNAYMILTKIGDCYAVNFTVNDMEKMECVCRGDFYRESDYFGYEKVALTPENFSEYYDVTVEPISFTYFSHNGSFMAEQKMVFTLREGLGYPSWCLGRGMVRTRYQTVEYNVETKTYNMTPFGSDIGEKPLDFGFFSYSATELVVKTDGTTVPMYGIVEWREDVAEGFTLTDVEGCVFVPKQ